MGGGEEVGCWIGYTTKLSKQSMREGEKKDRGRYTR